LTSVAAAAATLASELDIDLATITTQYLIDDIEALRSLHGIDRWLVFGGSWGSTLALAYAVEHPSRVSELVLRGVTTTTRGEVDWLTWGMGEIYPEAFAGLLALVPELERGANLPAAYNQLLMSADVDLGDRAARSWCAWEERLATLRGAPKPSPSLRRRHVSSRVRPTGDSLLRPVRIPPA